MKYSGFNTRSVVILACFTSSLLWGGAMPASAEEPAKPAAEASAPMPSLPFTMKFTKLPDKHIPDDVATYDSPLSTAVIDGEFWVLNHDAWRYKGQPILRYKGTNFDDLVRQPDGKFDNGDPGLKNDPQSAGGHQQNTSILAIS